MTIAKDGPQLPSVQVADALRSELRAGRKDEYAPGKKLSSIRELAERFGIAQETVKRALATLREEGLIFSVPNRGYFVTDPDRHNVSVADREDVHEAIAALRSELGELAVRVADLERLTGSADSRTEHNDG